MKLKCRSCGDAFRSLFISLIKTLHIDKFRLFEKCTELYNYEHSSDSDSFRSYAPCARVSCFDGPHCEVGPYTSQLYDWFSDNVGKYCAVKLKSGTYFTAYMDAFHRGRIVFSPDGVQKKQHFLITEIAKVQLIEPDDRRYRITHDEVTGYKGIYIRKGILDADSYIYELGIPYYEERRDPFDTDFQDVYSHFCISIEDVLYHWRDCITQSVLNAENGTYHDECRLFRVRAKDHCFSYHNGGWVSNDLTVLSEVTQEEIIEYFKQHPDFRERVMKKLESDRKTSDLWERYQKVTVKPYSNILSVQEIIKLCAEACPYHGSESCVVLKDHSKCFSCGFFDFNMVRFAYLIARKEIQDGAFRFTSSAYNALKRINNQPLLKSIQQLVDNRPRLVVPLRTTSGCQFDSDQ